MTNTGALISVTDIERFNMQYSLFSRLSNNIGHLFDISISTRSRQETSITISNNKFDQANAYKSLFKFEAPVVILTGNIFDQFFSRNFETLFALENVKRVFFSSNSFLTMQRQVLQIFEGQELVSFDGDRFEYKEWLSR